MKERRGWTSRAAQYLGSAESVVLMMIGVVLVLLAVLLLVNSGITLMRSVTDGSIATQAITVLDGVLLVLMTMEIVYTVAISLESHTLIAEPFLIIGAIAAIRRMLVITAVTTSTPGKEPSVEQFRSTLMELGLLAFIVIAMAGSIYILRRSQQGNLLVAQEPPGEGAHQ